MQIVGKAVVFVVAMAVIWYFVQQRQERNRAVLAHNEQVARENARLDREEAAEMQAATPRGRLDAVAAGCKGRITAFAQQGQQVTLTLESNSRDAFECFLVEAGMRGIMIRLDKTYDVPFQEAEDAQGTPLFRHSYRFDVQ